MLCHLLFFFSLVTISSQCHILQKTGAEGAQDRLALFGLGGALVAKYRYMISQV